MDRSRIRRSADGAGPQAASSPQRWHQVLPGRRSDLRVTRGVPGLHVVLPGRRDHLDHLLDGVGSLATGVPDDRLQGQRQPGDRDDAQRRRAPRGCLGRYEHLHVLRSADHAARGADADRRDRDGRRRCRQGTAARVQLVRYDRIRPRVG